MNKSIVALAWLSVLMLSAPVHAQNSAQQSGNGQTTPNKSADQAGKSEASGQGAGAPVTENVRKSSEGKAAGNGSTESEGPRATGAGPSVPRTGNGAATSGSNTNSTSGQSSGSSNSGDAAR